MANLSSNIIVTGISFLLTLMVLSYLIGDNPLFRIAIYLFVGVSAGYVATVAWYHVLWPKLFEPILYGSFEERLLIFIPLVLGILLLAKLSPRVARLGNPSMALLVGVGAAVAIGGAVMGTLIPQTQASINLFDLGTDSNPLEKIIEGVIILVGTLTTLIYFHFGARPTPGGPQRNQLVKLLSWIGQIFIAITFGVLFAGAFAAALTALIERLNFLWEFLTALA